MEYITKNTKETNAVAEELVAKLVPSNECATVVGLCGDLGSGKTTFAQAIARVLGISDPIQSPTFVIMKAYNLQLTTYNKLVHIDAYRLENGKEIERLGFKELLADPKNLIFIEWPERIIDAMPEHQKLHFTFIDETTRRIKN